MSTPNDGSDLTSDLNQEEIKDRQSPEFHGGLLETQIAKPSIWTREEPFSAIPSMSTVHLSVGRPCAGGVWLCASSTPRSDQSRKRVNCSLHTHAFQASSILPGR